MVENSLARIQVLPEEQYLFHAYSAPVRLRLRQVVERLSTGVCERYSTDCLIYHHEENQKIFIFKYGTVVFFNFPVEEHVYYLSWIGINPQPQVIGDHVEPLTEEDFALKIAPGTNDVAFNSVTVPRLDIEALQLIAQALAQSSALEMIEHEVSTFLAESEKMTGFLKEGGGEPGIRKRKTLLNFLGRGLGTRHRILNQLALLSEPAPVWEKEDLYNIHRKLVANLDINERTAKVEKMLALQTEVTGLLLGIVDTRRAEILELIIIVLILIEVLRAVLAG